MKLFVESQSVRAYGAQTKVVADSINFVTCEFLFSDDWDGMEKVAQFTQDGDTYNQLLDDDGTCMLPGEIVEGKCVISVFGQIGDETVRSTTDSYTLKIYESGFVADGEDSIPPTEDLYSQFVAKVQAAADNVTNMTVSSETGAAGSDADV